MVYTTRASSLPPLCIQKTNEIMVECVGAMVFFVPGVADMIIIGYIYINPIVPDG